MHQVKVRKYIRMHGLGMAVIAALAATALNGSCFFDTKNTICANGRLCPLGWTCTADQDGCTRDGCGDEVIDISNGEVCDDGNKSDGDGCDSNCTPTGCHNGIQAHKEMCDDGNMDNDDECVDECMIARCGDSHIHMRVEDCDDGNAITDVCPYGQTLCRVCDNTCHFADGAISLCGDGEEQSQFENCDDHNNELCGTCSSDCQTFALDYAAGWIDLIDVSKIEDKDTFALDDGINPKVTFEFDNDGVFMPNVQISLTPPDPPDPPDPTLVSQRVEQAINHSPEALLIRAFRENSNPLRVNLKHMQPTTLGNRDVVLNPISMGFVVERMTGGAGGDCPYGVGCKSKFDCKTNVCLQNNTCGCQSNADCVSNICLSNHTCG
jgi:cysteine-rich repeat protein